MLEVGGDEGVLDWVAQIVEGLSRLHTPLAVQFHGAGEEKLIVLDQKLYDPRMNTFKFECHRFVVLWDVDGLTIKVEDVHFFR